MKVLWICNMANNDVCKYKNEDGYFGGGWLTGLSDGIKKEDNIELAYCYPLLNQKKQDDFIYNGVHYYSFYSNPKYRFLNRIGFVSQEDNKHCSLQEKQINYIIEKENPDIIHIFGTEYYHSLITANLCFEKRKMVCSIQGLTSVISRHYLSLLPNDICKKNNLHSLFKGTLYKQQKEMRKRGNIEKQVLNKCDNVIGRTDFDKACTYYINENRKYFFCNESLRQSFYKSIWDEKGIEKNTIFFSQGASPLKGLNIVLEALRYLKCEYPNVRLKIAGENFIKYETLKDKLKISTYGNYIRKMINDYELTDYVVFTGILNEEEMVSEMLKANVFVSASSIENSSNSVCEAMLLGVPVVSSDVGGIKSLLQHEKEGLLYQADAPYMLAYNIKRIFDNKDLQLKLSKNAREKAKMTHDIKTNSKRLSKIYDEILVDYL